MPFYWKNPLGYLIAVVLELVVYSLPILYYANMMSIAIGGYFFGITVLKDCKNITKSCNRMIKHSKATQLEILKRLYDGVCLSKPKQ